MMGKVIRVSDEQKKWLDKKKEEYFNTKNVSYRAVIEKIKKEL